MEKKKVGKGLIIIGILIAFIPNLLFFAFLGSSEGTFPLPANAEWIIFFFGIAIAIYGEYLNRT